MAWTPMTGATFDDADILTGAAMDQIVGNINETSAATAQEAGDIITANAANSMGHRVPAGDEGELLTMGSGGQPVWRPRLPRLAMGTAASGSFTGEIMSPVSGDFPGGIPSTWAGAYSIVAHATINITSFTTADEIVISIVIGGTVEGAQTFTTAGVKHVTAFKANLSAVGDGIGVRLRLNANGTGTWADAWVTGQACYGT